MTDSPREVAMVLKSSDGGNYGHLHAMIAEFFSRGFVECGMDSVTLDIASDSFPDTLRGIVEGSKISFFFVISGIGLPDGTGTGTGTDFFNRVGAPLFSYTMSHPLYHYRHASIGLANCNFGFFQTSQIPFARQIYPPSAAVHYIAPASRVIEPMSWHDKDIPIIMTASLWKKPWAIRESWRDFPPVHEENLNHMVDLHRHCPEAPLESLITRVVDEKHRNIDNDIAYFNELDGYFIGLRRLEALRELAGLPVVVTGSGWDDVAEDFPNARFKGQLHWDEMFDLQRRSKISINPYPEYYEMHKRVFNAMSCGSVPVTHRNPAIEGLFDDDDLVYYSSTLSDAAERISTILSDDGVGASVSSRGRQKFLGNHTWTHRARTVLDILGIEHGGRAE